MKEKPINRGLLVIALIIMIIAGGLLVKGTSYAEAADESETVHTAYVVGYPDGLVRPLSVITREETAVFFYRLMADESRNTYASIKHSFKDVDDNRWSSDEIATLAGAGILQGYEDGSFQPDKPVTRAEFSVIAAKFSRIDDRFNYKTDDKAYNATEEKLSDTEGHWAEKYINDSVGTGWIKEYGDGTFRPDYTIIRCEAMMLINNVFDRRVNLAGLCEDTAQWPDNTPDKWYYEIVLEATNSHVYERTDKPKSIETWIKILNQPAW